MNGKDLNDMQRKAMVYDIERGKAAGILPLPWQTDTCIGSWHYKLERLEKHLYVRRFDHHPDARGHREQKRQPDVERAVERDGMPDSDEIKIVTDIGAWLKVNGEAIFATRPLEGFWRRSLDDCGGWSARWPPNCRGEQTLHAGGHPLHAVQGRQDDLRHRPRDSRRRQNHHQIARRRFAKLDRQHRQRPAARSFRRIEIHPRRKWPARHVADKAAEPGRIRAANPVLRKIAGKITSCGQWWV